MIHVALRFKVFFRPTEFLPPVFKWVDLLPADTDRCVLADCVLDRRPWRARPQSLLRGSSSRREGGFVVFGRGKSSKVIDRAVSVCLDKNCSTWSSSPCIRWRSAVYSAGIFCPRQDCLRRLRSIYRRRSSRLVVVLEKDSLYSYGTLQRSAFDSLKFAVTVIITPSRPLNNSPQRMNLERLS